MDCRGTERREWIVANYDVKPVAHIQLLTGQTKHSDAGATIENEYYIFEAVSKHTGKKELIYCGMGAAKDFLKLLNHPGLPLFNPLKEIHIETEKQGNSKVRAEGKLTSSSHKEQWNPVAKQLYNAIMWTIIIINAKPDTPIFELKEKIYTYKKNKPYDSQIKGTNSIIGKCLRDKTLTQAIEELKTYNDIKEELCDFSLIKEAIRKMRDSEGGALNIEPHF